MIFAALFAMLLMLGFACLVIFACTSLYRSSCRFRALRPLFVMALAWHLVILAMLVDPMTKMGLWVVAAVIVESQGVEK